MMDIFFERAFVLAAIARSKSQLFLTTVQSHEQLTWIEDVSQFAKSGYLQVLVLVISALWTAFRLLNRRTKDYSAEAQAAAIKWPWELCAQVSRATALAFLALAAAVDARRQTQWLDVVAVGYAFLFGILRLFNDVEWRHVALHQVNFILAAELLIQLASHALPCIEAASTCAIEAPVRGGLVSLAVAVVVALTTPREWVPPSLWHKMPEGYEIGEPAPEETCSWVNYYLTFEWITPMVWKGSRRDVTLDDMPRLPWYDEPLLMLDKIKKARAKGKTTLWTVFYLLRSEVSLMAFYVGLAYACELIAPYGLYRLLAYLADPKGALIRPWVWLSLIFCGPLSRSVLFQQYVFTSTRLIVRLRSALTQELYHRAVSSMELEDDIFAPKEKAEKKTDENNARSSTPAGRLANLMAADVQAIFSSRDIVMVSMGVPTGTIIAFIGLYKMMGWPALVGMAILLLAAPMSAIVARLMAKATRKARRAQDSRISLVSEYLASIRAVKYFAWEDAIIKTIEETRANEQRDLWRVSLIYVALNQVTALMPYCALISMFALYVGVCKQPMTAATAFTTAYLVKTIRRNVTQVGIFSRNITNAIIALGRLDKYFESTTPLEEYPEGPLHLQEATFRRNKKATFRLKDISIDFVEGGLNVVSGASGSGKTTLLLAILGETIKESGSITRPRDIAFASQTAWLQNGTIRENILFNSPFEKVRYDNIVHACCLPVDLREMDHGDQTVVGENGSSLSGGQKARVALARALYTKAPLLLLDDVFSALDAKTSALLWERCFCSDLLKGRTVVLVAQQPWVAAQADISVTLENGEVKNMEQNLGVVRHTVAVARDVEEAAAAAADGSEGSDTEVETQTDTLNDRVKVADDKGPRDVVAQEMKASGKSARLTFFQYMTYFGGPWYAVFSLFVMFLSSVAVMAGSLWLSFWVEAYNHEAVVDVAYYLGIYAAITVAESLIYVLVFLVFENGAWHAARRLHNDFIRAVMRVSLSWYKKTPVGRIINRFSSDMSSLDLTVSPQLRAFLEGAMSLIIRIVGISSIMPVFMLPAAVTCFVGVLIGEMYTRTAVTIKRLVASSQSPIFTQFADTLAGLAVIRAGRGMPETFGKLLADKMRVWSRAAEANYNCNRWVAMRVDVVTALVGLSAGIIAVSKAGVIGAGLVGFSLNNATGLSQTILMLVRSMNDLEIELQSFVRIKEYAGLEAEEKSDESYPEEGDYADNPETVIPKSWPAKGEIEFRNVTIRYDENGPDILKDVNLKFRAGERVAIVGRTGSGKSTLVLSLLRFTHIVSGQILYDGIDITKIPRRRLREALTIIPQEAVLFNGTLRSNLDPTGTIPAPVLERALESCQGIASFQYHSGETTADESEAEAVEAGPDTLTTTTTTTGLALSTTVTAKGENFSHGQRQVLSLCRALVRRSRLMLLDEATASMDYETDRGIQAVLRREVVADRTLVTIAHRLRTIADYDTVVVMGAGRVVEAGSPRELYACRGVFYDMVHHSGERDDLEELLGAAGSESK